MKKLRKKLTAVVLAAVVALTGMNFGGIGGLTVAAAETIGAFTVTGGEYDTDYTYADDVLTIKSNTSITIANTNPDEATTDRIEVEKDVFANITLAGVKIDVSSSEGTAAFKIADHSTGNVTITLADGSENTLKSGRNCAGLQKNGDTSTGTLTIQGGTNGTGKLTATGGMYGAGIGGNYGGSGSNIKISGGIVTASGNGGAGIGSGPQGSGSGITISGGTVTATGYGGAGIGSGYGGSGSDITISGGTVTATGENGGGAGIGGGQDGSGSNIEISGGTVTATGENGGAGIGGGQDGFGSNIEISGGTVTATGENGGAGIGGGQDGFGSNIEISGGTVTATGENGGAGIGGGQDGFGSNIEISGGTVTATGENGGAGIGGGRNGSGLDITISGGSVKAVVSGGANTIGGGTDGNGAVTPTSDGRTPVYLLEIKNSASAAITINDTPYPTNHNGEEKIYAYLPEKTLTDPNVVTVGTETTKYIYDNSQWCIVPTVTAPTPNKLVYKGKEQALVTAGTTTGGTMVYSLNEKGEYTEVIPTGKDAGNYIVWYKVEGNEDYADTLPASVEVTIEKAGSGVETAPKAKENLTYDGTAQALVDEGSNVTGAILQYSTSRNGAYSEAVPTGKDAKEYSVWYKVVGDANHTDTEPAEIKVTIAPLTITNDNTAINLGTPLTYTGAEQTQSIASVTVGTMTLGAGDYTVSGNTGTNAGDDYELTVTGTGNFTGTVTKKFSISKKSVTGTSQTLLVKTNQAKDITYDLSKLLPAGVTGTTTYKVGEFFKEDGVLSSEPTDADITDGKLTLHVAAVDSADKISRVIIFCLNDNYDISETSLTVQTTDKTPVALSGVSCDSRTYNGNAYAYAGTSVWKTENGTAVTGETTVTYYNYNVGDPDTPVDAPKNAGSYRAVFTITTDDYVGTASYIFEITKAQITVAAKNKSIYVGDAVPVLTTPAVGTDYTVTGLCGTDALGGMATMSYAQKPDNTKTGTYEIQISGLTAPAGDNYTLAFANGTLTIETKPSGGGSIGGDSAGGGSSSGGSSGGATDGTGDKTEGSGNITTITNKDGSTTTTKTETDAKGNTVTTTTKTDADGNVTGVTEKSVINNIEKNTTATVTVKTDGDGNVTSANASVTRTSDSSKVSLSGKVLGQITEAAGADTKVRVTMTVRDSKGNTKYKVQADADEILPGEKLYIYKLNTKTGTYTMVNDKEYKVTKAGTVTVNMSRKATYELVTAKEAKAIEKAILATVKPAKSSKTLSEGKKTTFKLSDKLDMDNVKSITYATSRKSIVTVTKKGTITAVKAGTATIKAIVTLKNGTKKTVKMTIKVK
ncbi:Ig-like domain-containing protein [Acetivibrio ethanolgignens]|uniref:BIG2 domain-containing protein n=1 Tax=Acetivibrio ethanolgignens TaxID=290052 RepID=A0A0V8QIM5_9FIRM|nr:Ig-like domain-containing protein [Acetivibrio ethanolgignens]KSV60459.1 hypothetical protein ASU35_16870 [Acetivibrio ethanolgignens]